MASTWPDFFIVGAARSGTTSLYQYLAQHPDVYMPANKEPHWFSRVRRLPGLGSHPVTSEQEYLRLFRRQNREAVAGEASTSYLWDKEAPYRIKEAVPHAKVIAILRHPVERAYSHYLLDVQAGKQHLPFRQALEQAYRAEAKGWGITDLYIDLGFYAEQLRRYFEAFDRTRIQVFLHEDLIGDRRALLGSLMEFLEVDPRYADSIQTDVQYNKYSIPKNRLAKRILDSRLFRCRRASALRAKIIPDHGVRTWIRSSLLLREGIKPPLDEASRSFLMELYGPDIRKLQSLLGRDLGHWLGVESGGPLAGARREG